MPPARRSAVGLVAQAHPRSSSGTTIRVDAVDRGGHLRRCPRELLRSVSLTQTLQLIR
jgi:hypothetical protein